MELLPLLIPTPDEPALLPGERRRLLLTEPRMLTAVRLALRGERKLAFLAFDPGYALHGDDGVPAPEKLLPVATACDLLEAEVEGELGFAVIRGRARVEIGGTSSGGCCDHDDPYKDGTEIRVAELVQPGGVELGGLERVLTDLGIRPALRGEPVARIDRLAAWLAAPSWVKGEILCTPPAVRVERLIDFARELALPGGSQRDEDLQLPYADADEHFDDLVRQYDCRSRALPPLNAGDQHRWEAQAQMARLSRRRRAARIRTRAVATRIAHRVKASEAVGTLPALERIRAAHQLPEGAVDALLVAGLSNHERFGDRVRQAARLLPPEELPLAAWIDALEAGVFREA